MNGVVPENPSVTDPLAVRVFPEHARQHAPAGVIERLMVVPASVSDPEKMTEPPINTPRRCKSPVWLNVTLPLASVVAERN